MWGPNESETVLSQFQKSFLGYPINFIATQGKVEVDIGGTRYFYSVEHATSVLKVEKQSKFVFENIIQECSVQKVPTNKVFREFYLRWSLLEMHKDSLTVYSILLKNCEQFLSLSKPLTFCWKIT